ncbi:MAG: gamma-glutamyltransferase [Bryobacteraceae bacterium]
MTKARMWWLLGLVCLPALAQEAPVKETQRVQARSMVITRYGIVATSQTLASAAGVKVLEAGGSAVDAAIAANATLGLVEPNSNGVGGDLFAIVYEAKTKKLYGLNASGWAPSGLTPEFLSGKGITTMPQLGIYSVTVPGAVAGWDALHKKFGRMAWADLFKPAVKYAEEGFPVTEWISGGWKASVSKFKSPEAARVYLPNGHPLAVGEVFHNPLLAKTLSLIAEKGRDGFYKGSVAQAIVDVSKAEGGTMTATDLADFKPEWVEPISTTYRGWTVFELPPNGQGIAALSMLNIMERFPMGEYGANSTKALHVEIEAKKLAYADMLRYVGDPRSSKIPVEKMLSKELGATHAREIDENKAACKVTPADLLSVARQPGADTIYMTVVDREGNMVSLIQSNYLGFGSGVVPVNAGFMLQNRGGLFTLEADQPNTLAPRKRPLHTIIPAFMTKDDRRISFGIMGGWNQSQAHAQFVANIVDFEMNIQSAMESARFTKQTFDGCDVDIEARVPESVRDELTKMGHQVKVLAPYAGAVGGGQAVMVNDAGIHFGASDARKDGAALPESPGFFSVPPAKRKK